MSAWNGLQKGGTDSAAVHLASRGGCSVLAPGLHVGQPTSGAAAAHTCCLLTLLYRPPFLPPPSLPHPFLQVPRRHDSDAGRLWGRHLRRRDLRRWLHTGFRLHRLWLLLVGFPGQRAARRLLTPLTLVRLPKMTASGLATLALTGMPTRRLTRPVRPSTPPTPLCRHDSLGTANSDTLTALLDLVGLALPDCTSAETAPPPEDTNTTGTTDPNGSGTTDPNNNQTTDINA